MVELPHGARRSEFKVFPTTWNKKMSFDASVHWYVTYRYYSAEDEIKQVHIRGMNKLIEWQARRDSTVKLIKEEEAELKNGYNPLKKKRIAPVNTNFVIDPDTPFFDALKKVKLTVGKRTSDEIRKMLPHIKKAAQALDLIDLSISEVRKRHIKAILDNRQLTPSMFNHYRSYLQMLFKELSEMEAVEHNVVKDISIKKITKKIRETLKLESRIEVDNHLKAKQPRFHNFMHLFFHSGARESELYRLKGKDVDLQNQSFKVMVMKSGKPKEVLKPIKDIALEYWQFAMLSCGPEDFVFARGLKPGKVAVSSTQISRRWNRHVKKKLGITSDFYALKHLNTTEVVTLLNAEDAAKLNSHTSDSYG
jgi:integrase